MWRTKISRHSTRPTLKQSCTHPRRKRAHPSPWRQWGGRPYSAPSVVTPGTLSKLSAKEQRQQTRMLGFHEDVEAAESVAFYALCRTRQARLNEGDS
eukprot:SAG11_NODE_14320_length_617_cov_0.573359_1_plen_96_part_10